MEFSSFLCVWLSVRKKKKKKKKVVGKYLARGWNNVQNNMDLITTLGKYPDAAFGFQDTWVKPDGTTYQEGEIFRNPNLASTLRRISAGGRDAFYRGEIAQEIAAWGKYNFNEFVLYRVIFLFSSLCSFVIACSVHNEKKAPTVGLQLTFEDFAAHSSSWVQTMNVTYRGFEVHEIPPNGQGISALQMLNILEGFDLEAMGLNSADYLHVQLEAKKLAFADRAAFYAVNLKIS